MKCQAITGTLEALNSRRDVHGNCYWALRYTDHATGAVVVGKVSGGESNINAIRAHWTNPDGWDRSIMMRTQELPIREFNRLTRDWPYAGCRPEALATFIQNELSPGPFRED